MIDIVSPAEQEGTKAIVRNWLKKIGDKVAADEPLVELETDKVTQEVASPAAGILAEILLGTDSEVAPGALLGRLRSADEAGAKAAEAHVPAAAPAPAATAQHGSASSRDLSPAVRRAVQQHGLDPATIEGSGRNGRITMDDIERTLARGPALPAAAPAPAAARPAPAVVGGVQSIPHDRMRLAIAANMLNSVTIAPHVTAVFEADFSAIIAHRQKHKAAFEKQGANLTFTAYLIAASVAAMRAAPAINSRWYDDRLEIFSDINVGIGTALGEKGLVVPVVHQAQDLSLQGIAARLTSLTAAARSNTLTPADMRGGTFTISNHGVSGSLFASPIIINQPQSAILGVGKLEKRVVVKEVGGVDSIQIRPMCYVSLTIDHRVVDGHQTNGWLSKFVETLETWPLS